MSLFLIVIAFLLTVIGLIAYQTIMDDKLKRTIEKVRLLENELRKIKEDMGEIKNA